LAWAKALEYAPNSAKKRPAKKTSIPIKTRRLKKADRDVDFVLIYGLSDQQIVLVSVAALCHQFA